MIPLLFGVDGFDAPGRLWLLAAVPLLVLAYILVLRLKARHAMRYTNTTVMSQVMPGQSQWLRHVTVALALLSLVALAVAWAKPLGIDKVPRERATVVLVIDVSQSMAATDVDPTRLDAAKAQAKNFAAGLPAGYNVSLVSLSGNPAVRLPPMTDRAMLNRAIDALTLQDSTAIGDAITAALGAVAQAPKGDDGSAAPAMIVLLSDGTNTAGQSPLQKAVDAKTAKVPIFTIAFGTDNGYVDLDGERHTVPPDKQTLEQIATLTGGQAFTADNVGQLKNAYTAIKSQIGYEPVKKEVTATAAGIGLIFAFVAAVGAVILGARWR